MAGYDKTKPSRNDSYINVLDDVRAKDDALAVMFNGVSLTDIPVNAVNFSGGVFGLWNGSSFVTQPVAIGGGGTGATTAAGARTALGVTSTTDLAADYLSKAGNFSGLTDKPAARTELDVYGKSETYTKTEVDARTPDASTSVKGLVQLNNTLTSTSTTLALTAAQGKVLKDTVDGKTNEAYVDGYFQSQVITLPATNDGTFSNGGLVVSRVNNVVTITGELGFLSSTTSNITSDANFLPAWALPASHTPCSACYEFSAGYISKIIIFSSGTLRHRLEDASGGLVPLRSTTGVFTISYVI